MSPTRRSASSRTASGRRADVAVVGGGIVGAACALALAREGLAVSLIEAGAPPSWSAADPDLRVYALAPDNVALLDALEVWPTVRGARAHAYRRMHVWDAAGGEALRFDADAFAEPQLGWIVEHALLQDRLWAALPAAGVAVRTEAAVDALQQEEGGVVLTLEDGLTVEARLAIAADGGASRLRTLAGVETDRHDYAQRGVVAYIGHALPHEDTAWQRFLPTGPLAFLPCSARPDAPHASSIVWTLPEAEAMRVLALDDDVFGRELADAFAARLGDCRPLSKRVGFPLRREIARSFVAGRVLALGDAAHVVHPLAGQGVNLGLRDVAALAAAVRDAQARRVAWDSPHRLARWARQRRSDGAASAHAFGAINRLFSNDDVALTLLRGHGLGLVGRVAPLARALWRHAAGR